MASARNFDKMKKQILKGEEYTPLRTLGIINCPNCMSNIWLRWLDSSNPSLLCIYLLFED